MRKLFAEPFAAIPFWSNKVVAFLFYFRVGVGQKKTNRLSVLNDFTRNKSYIKVKTANLTNKYTARMFQYPRRTAIVTDKEMGAKNIETCLPKDES